MMESSIRMHRFETIRSSCRYVEGNRLWLGKATLTATAVKITGWHGFNRYVRRVLLDDLQSVSRRPETARSNIAFRLMDGSIWSAEVSAPGLWRIEAAQRIRAINPDRSGDGDEVTMSVSSWPVAEEPVVEERIVAEPVAEEPVVEAPVVEAPVVEAPIAVEQVAEEPVVVASMVEEPIEEWLEGPSQAISSDVIEPEVELEIPDPVLVSYSLTEAYSVAAGTDFLDAEMPWVEPEPELEPDPELSVESSLADQEPAPGWRPIHLIVSGKRVTTGWKSIYDLDSHSLARG